MQISNQSQIVGASGAASGSKHAGAGQGTNTPGFSDILHEETTDSAPDISQPDISETAKLTQMQRELAAYNEARERDIQGRSSNPPAYQIALPVNANGYMPYLTLDQQKQMDRITDSYVGRPAEEFEKLWDELRQHNLHPEQLAHSASYFINLEGEIVSRDVATAGRQSAPVASTAWTASVV